MYFSTINHYGILKLLVTLKNIQLIKDIKLKKKKKFQVLLTTINYAGKF